MVYEKTKHKKVHTFKAFWNAKFLTESARTRFGADVSKYLDLSKDLNKSKPYEAPNKFAVPMVYEKTK